MTKRLEVLIVDDQRLMREGLRTLLELEADIDVVGEAENGAEALERYDQLRPNIVLMDIRMPQMDGVEATRRLCSRWPEAKILILTTFDEDAYVIEGLQAGALGYLLKDVSGEELAAAVRTIAAGNALIGSEVARKVLTGLSHRPSQPLKPGTAEPVEPLSDRELEILDLIAQGFSNPDIADRLFLAEGTVKNYVTSILQKTGTKDRTEAAVKGKTLGWI
jgi:DNA-binding NarL/FixJ family response regulator